MRLLAVVVSSAIVVACSERDAKKTPVATASAVSTVATTDAQADGGASFADASAPSADASIADAVPETLDPELVATDGAPLGQTDAMPSIESRSYRTRIELLWRAIVRDEPALAADAFFPVVAYEQVKAIPKPSADWNARLMKAFARDIHAYHKKIGDEPERARLLRLDVPLDKAKWMAPGTEGNKLGYYRVLRATLRYVNGSGKEGALDVTSMISWRGEWFVVHLAGFK